MSGSCASKLDSDGVGLYVHVPFCRVKCRYCGFYSEPIGNYDAGAVVDAMIAEMGRYEFARGVRTIYIGGGSPSCLARRDLLRLVTEAARWGPAAEEFTVEVNPGQVDLSLLTELRAAGVNRLSIGAQSFMQLELDFLGRGHSVDSIYEAVRFGREAGFENISLDLILAVPGADLDSWKHNLNAAIGTAVDHISAYSLTYEDGTPLARDVAAGSVKPVDEDTDRAMYELAIDELAAAGMEQYEISNFARRGFQCRHNLNYWANGDYVGIGPGASSYLRGTRSTNFADIGKYIEAVGSGASTFATSETLGEVERACETAVLNLRRRCGIDLAQFERQTGFDAMKLFAGPIGMYLEQGLIRSENGRIFLRRQALGIADSVLCDFAAV